MINNMDRPDVKIPPPVLTLLHILAAFVLNWLSPLTTDQGILKWAGVAITLVGFVFAMTAARSFFAAGTTLDPHGSTTSIVRAGPYRISRNPIYLGFVCALIGIPLALGTFWGLLLVPIFIIFISQLVIQHEEAYLEKKFGDVYTSYRSRVRRWL